jgi:hypothetical protein
MMHWLLQPGTLLQSMDAMDSPYGGAHIRVVLRFYDAAMRDLFLADIEKW